MRPQFKPIFPVFVMIILIASWAFVSPVEALTWAEQPLLAWERATLKTFDINNYDKVIARAKEQDDDPNGNAPLFIYFSHAQKYYLEKNRASAVYYKQQYNILLNRLSGSNIAVLTRLVVMPQTSWNKKINNKFLGAACLALIEDPALPMLREAASMGNANAASTIQLIQDARGACLARYQDSTWYSATGR